MRTCPNCEIETTLLECPRCGANLPRKTERPREQTVAAQVADSASGIELEVCHDIAARQAKGLAKYGVTVANNPLGLEEWLQHAYEETLDQAIYLKRAIRSLERQAHTRGGRPKTMKTPKTSTPDSLGAATGSAFWTWHVRKELPDGMFTFCRYNATHGPVTSEHVRNSPHVKEWLGSDRLDDIYHPENTR